jgi:hypothetical protein
MTFQSSGSQAARGGYANEAWVKDSINQRSDLGLQLLAAMGVDSSSRATAAHVPSRLSKLVFGALLGLPSVSVEALKTSTQHQKADLLIQIPSSRHIAASLKKANAGSDFNQVDRRPVHVYQRFWRFSDEVALALKLFTGDLSSADFATHAHGLRSDESHRRITFPDLHKSQQAAVLQFFEANKRAIVSDLVRGRGPLAADFMILTQRDGPTTRIHVSRIDDVISFLCQAPVCPGPRTTFNVGHLTAQRKGGTPDPTSLQFKLKPSILLAVKGQTLVC